MLGDNLLQRKNNLKNQDVFFDNGTIKVVLMGCLAIAVSLTVMCISSILIAKNAVVSNLKKVEIQYMAGSISSNIDAQIEKAVDASLILSNDQTVIQWVRSGEKDENAGSAAKAKMLELVNGLGYDTSFLTSAVSNNYWSCSSQGMKLLYTVSGDDPADSWFFKTLQMKKPYEINIDYDRGLKNTYVWINSLVGDVNNPVAVTGVGMNLSDVIRNLIAVDSKNGQKNEIWLVDNTGDIYLSKDSQYMNKNMSLFVPEELKNKILNSDKSSDTFYPAEYKDKKGQVYDVVYKKIANTNWNLVVQIPRAESLRFLNTIVINTIAACLLAIIIVIVMFNILSKRIADPYKRAMLINEELERKIGERTKELNEKNTKIQDSIDYAKIIQKTILPSPQEIRQAFEQYFAIWEPRDTVGGDFYWIRKFDDGVLVILGDCTGHGVPGSLMTMAVNTILNQIIDEKHHNDPALILNELDRLLKQNLRRDQNKEMIQDGLDAGILFISSECKIVFSGAQIPIWIAYGNDIKEIKGNRKSLGSDRSGKGKEFTNTQIDYVKDMVLYMATDGLKDQPGGLHGFPYGRSRIISLLSSINRLPLDEQKREIITSFQDYMKDEQRRDDIAVIGIRI